MLVMLRHQGKPWSLNRERSMNLWEHRRQTESVRELTHWRMNGIVGRPLPDGIHVTATFRQCQPLHDTGNDYPIVKAMLDGMRDAKVLVDDTPFYVASVTLLAPVFVAHRVEQCTTLALQDTLPGLTHCTDCGTDITSFADRVLAATCPCITPPKRKRAHT